MACENWQGFLWSFTFTYAQIESVLRLRSAHWLFVLVFWKNLFRNIFNLEAKIMYFSYKYPPSEWTELHQRLLDSLMTRSSESGNRFIRTRPWSTLWTRFTWSLIKNRWLVFLVLCYLDPMLNCWWSVCQPPEMSGFWTIEPMACRVTSVYLIGKLPDTVSFLLWEATGIPNS